MGSNISLSNSDIYLKTPVYRREKINREKKFAQASPTRYIDIYFDRVFFPVLFIFSLGFVVRYMFAWALPVPLPFADVATGLKISVTLIALSAWVQGRFQMHIVALLLRGFTLFTIGAMGSGFMAAVPYYIGRGIAFKDSSLLAADQMLGFDWLSYVKFVDAHAWLNAVLYPAYQSIGWQPLPILFVLACKLDYKAVYAFLTVEILGLMAVSITAIFVPCLGVYQFFGLAFTDHPHVVLDNADRMTTAILWLRDATFRTPFRNDVGLITFPSFHAVSAVLYIWGWWRIPIARYYGLALNIAMLFATPVHGSHYLVDVIAGGLIAVSLLQCVRYLLGMTVPQRPAVRPLSKKVRLHRCIPAMS